MKVDVLLGLQWGDEGKGKVVDVLTPRYDVVARFQGATKYEACYAGESHCHQICTMCGKVTEVKAPEISEAIEQLHLRRFRKDGFSLYIYGICSTCQAVITRKNRYKNKITKK